MKQLNTAACLFFAILFFVACNTINKKELRDQKDSTTLSTADSLKFTVAMVDNAKDPTCGMPIGAGIGDTAHYNNKVLGFCSKECKDEFLKNAAKNISAVEWKK